ncbi:glycosyltransferase family 39 protein [Tardiphaga alba]|uniref:Glycosyltransferase family 39 protein n=1 Tax=Tardiphaga alba TaxID=340268 RepID=A0ABX8AAH0_9BRAD|nr:glycosyltransferase family 39 protein [Tardiphaga alba]QUS40771.1 glycosyltransferase family 39 protein [Tardiphaga alba]
MVRGAFAAVIALVVIRLIAAAWTPLTFDEAYYWMWSRHLAGGYYDHPPMVAVVIRLGTMIAGDTPFGVRVVSVLLTLPMSWAIYRTAELLFGGKRIAVSSMLLLNATMITSVGLMIVTPDAPLLVASSFVLLALAQVAATGQGVWWLAVGVAVGIALLSKYTALFFGAAILIWLVAVPRMRRWLLSPWPYLGGIVAFAVFSPVLFWNADHQWVSFIKQLGRARIEHFNPVYVAELVPTQFAFATPLVFILGTMGLYALARRNPGALPARVLVSVMFWVISLYFVWHALHARVEANWLAPVYPAFAIAAAVAATMVRWSPRTQRSVDFCLRWAGPGGAVLFVALVVQANTGLLSGYKRDATVRSIGVGFVELAAEIEAVRQRTGATCILVPDYGTTSWLTFYLPKGTCVAQRAERIRWVNMPEPTQAQLSGKLLLVGAINAAGQKEWQEAFAGIERVANLTRKRGPLVIEQVEIDLLTGPKGDVLDRSPPPELGGR